jgi:hypothetical protein
MRCPEFQLDQCMNDRRLAAACNEQGLATAWRFPKKLIRDGYHAFDDAGWDQALSRDEDGLSGDPMQLIAITDDQPAFRMAMNQRLLGLGHRGRSTALFGE